MKTLKESTSFTMLCRILIVMFAFSTMGLLSACDNDTDSPMENTGEQRDNTMEDSYNQSEDTGDKENTGDTAEDPMQQ